MAFLDGNGVTTLVRKLRTKFQETLVSGTNIKTINGDEILGSGNLTVQEKLSSGTNIKTINGKSILGTGNLKVRNTWFGTCSTGAATQTKVVVTKDVDFVLEIGSMVRVIFTNDQTYNGSIKLNVDDTGAKNVMKQGTTATVQYFFQAGEVVDFVYDGTNYIAVNEGIATTTYYGVTKLSNATNSTSTSLAATANSVKLAYDHADSKSTVSVSQTITSGTEIATINVNNHDTVLYIPDADSLIDAEVQELYDAVIEDE